MGLDRNKVILKRNHQQLRDIRTQMASQPVEIPADGGNGGGNKRSKPAAGLFNVRNSLPLNDQQVIQQNEPAIGIFGTELGDYTVKELTTGYSKYNDVNRANTSVPEYDQAFSSQFAQDLVEKAGAEAEKDYVAGLAAGKPTTMDEKLEGFRLREVARKEKVEELKKLGVDAIDDLVKAEANLEQFHQLFIKDHLDTPTALCAWPLMAAMRAEIKACPPPKDADYLRGATNHFLN